MLQKYLVVSCLLFFSQSIVLANYHINENVIDELFANSVDISISAFDHTNSSILSHGGMSNSEEEGPNYKIAAGIAITSTILPIGIYGSWFLITVFTGGFGIILLPGAMILAGAIGSPWHRYYLGTNDESFKIGALYCITFNGLGWLTIADAAALLMADENHRDYFDNSKFLMWIDEIEKK